VPLGGIVRVETTRPCRAEARIRDSERSWGAPGNETAATVHEIRVLGLRPGRSHDITVVLRSGDESITSGPLTIETPPLPEDFPATQLIRSQPGRMEPGVTLLDVHRWENSFPSLLVSWFIMVDHAGEVVWHLRVPEPSGGIRFLPNGNFRFLHGAQPTGMREIDLLGNVVRQYRATGTGVKAREGEIAVPVDTFHHDHLTLPNGHILVLSTECRRVEEYPSNFRQPRMTAPANVVGDVIVEMRPDGTIAGRWPLLDMLDPQRIGYGSLDRSWDLGVYPFKLSGTRDWSHTNSIIYDARDDSIVCCPRHQDAVVKFDRTTSEVQWILGTAAGWRGELAKKLLQPRERVEWPFHAHGIKYTPQGTLLLFDNGNGRAIPPARSEAPHRCYSRAVEYAIDEQSGTVRQEWSYGGPGSDRFFSAFVGDADWLSQTGNVLITDGGRLEDAAGRPLAELPGKVQWGRVLEVTRTGPAEVLFELHLSEKGRGNGFGSSIYRAERLPGLEALATTSSQEN
jgi:hypothetical protein